MRLAVRALFVLTLAADSLPAQQIAGPTYSSARYLSRATPTTANDDPVRLPVEPTHWKRGALIGGLGTGALFVILVEGGGCGCVVDALAFTPLLMIPGAFIGAMIGGAFPKGEASEQVSHAYAATGPLALQRRAAMSAADRQMIDIGKGFVESRTFWKEGGVLGGAATLVVGMLFYFEAREGQSPPSLLLLPPAAAISFLVGAGPGAFIGGLIPKPARVDTMSTAPVTPGR